MKPSRSSRSILLAAAFAAGISGAPLAAGDFQFEDNVKELIGSAKTLMAQGELEEAALEYENVLAIDGNHREAALAAFDAYLKLGAVSAAEELLGRFGRMGVDSAQVVVLRGKLDAVKASPPPKRLRVFTAAVPVMVMPAAPAGPAAPGPQAATVPGAPAKGVDLLDDGLGDLDGPAAPTPSSGAPAAPGASPAPGGKDDLDDISL